MALHLQTLKTRALSALVFVVVMLGGLLWNEWSFFLLFSIIHFGCWAEYNRLVEKINPGYGRLPALQRWATMLAGWAVMLWMSSEALQIGSFTLHALGSWLLLVFVMVLPVTTVLLTSRHDMHLMKYPMLGLVYISLSWALLVWIRQTEVNWQQQPVPNSGWMIALVLIFSIWINDTMAYMVGSIIGKTPLSPISPKKTWEGTIGGAVLCVLTVTLAGAYLLPLHYSWLLGTSAIAAVAGTLGDLLESKLKRMAMVKDSGHLMPGHGGFLDRFDSLLVATPFAALFVLVYSYLQS